MHPTNSPFLLKVLASIFASQVIFMSYGALKCENLNRCDEAAARIEQVFNVMIATTLSLLVGGSGASRTSTPRPSKPPVKRE